MSQFLVHACPTELPGNLHVSLNYLSRLTGLDSGQLKAALGAVAPLGYTVRLRPEEHEDASVLGDDEFAVLEYGTLHVLPHEDEWIENLD